LPIIYIYIKFYDKDDNLLARIHDPLQGIISNLPDTYTETCSIQIYKYQFEFYSKEEYFDLVESVKFEICRELAHGTKGVMEAGVLIFFGYLRLSEGSKVLLADYDVDGEN